MLACSFEAAVVPPAEAASAAASSRARCRARRAHPTAVHLEDGRGYREPQWLLLRILSQKYLGKTNLNCSKTVKKLSTLLLHDQLLKLNPP